MPRVTALLLLIAGPAAAADRTHVVTSDDYATIATATELAVSPDGKQVAYCEARWDAVDDLRKTDLWVVATDGKTKPVRLTFDRANDRHPKWAADGSAVYVLADRKRAAEANPPYDGKAQVWRVPAGGGEPRAVTRADGGVAHYDYAPKADAVFFSTDTTTTDEDAFSKLRAKYKAEYGHGTRTVSAVHRLDLQTWRTDKVIDEKRYVRELAVTLDGKRLAMIAAADDTVIRSEGGSRVDVWDADTGKVTPTDEGWRKTAASPYPWLQSLVWELSGTRFAFCTVFDAFPAEVVVSEYSAEGIWCTRKVNRGETYIRGYGSELRWPKYQLMALSENQGSVLTSVLLFGKRDDIQASTRGVTLPAFVYTAADAVVADDGIHEVFAASTPDDFNEVFTYIKVANDVSTRLALTSLNPQAATWRLPTVRHVTWTAPDGSAVGGVLELPPGYKKGDNLPLVVSIHGGPTTSSKTELTFDPLNGRLYLSAHGYAVLCPNYRGSTGYGDKFVTDLIGNENDLDVKDILAGVQHLVKEGIADPDRVGVMGWSNGGYLTNCLITMKDSPVKFKAASSGAGILDTVAEWGFNDEPAYPVVFKKGAPWETPDVYRKTSPTYGLGNVTTPTLIHVGANDERCPPGHSRMLYRALKEYRKVPTELIVYPGEPHGPTKLSHRKAKMEWDLAWFDKYLLGK